MNESKLTTVGEIREFLVATADIYWTPKRMIKPAMHLFAMYNPAFRQGAHPRLSRVDQRITASGLSPSCFCTEVCP